jgi:PAS domain S-box-containing protein
VVVHPDDLDRLVREWLALVMPVNQVNWKLRIGDLTESTDGSSYVVPQLDAEGNLVRWFGSNTDIEVRKRAEKKLLEDERELRRIADAIPQSIAVLDPSGVVLYVNQSSLDYTGLTAQDLSSPQARERVIHSDDVERIRDERKAALARGLPLNLKRENGEGRAVSLVPHPLQPIPRRTGTLALRTGDIDDRKRRRQDTKRKRCYAKTSYAHPCSRKSSVLESLRQVLVWFRRWLHRFHSFGFR